MTKFRIEGSSFRDRSGFLFFHEKSLYRAINSSYKEEYDYLISSGLYKKLTELHLLISHTEMENLEIDCNYYKIIYIIGRFLPKITKQTQRDNTRTKGRNRFKNIFLPSTNLKYTIHHYHHHFIIGRTVGQQWRHNTACTASARR